MQKLGFDVCHRPFFCFWVILVALYTPIRVGLMYVSPYIKMQYIYLIIFEKRKWLFFLFVIECAKIANVVIAIKKKKR